MKKINKVIDIITKCLVPAMPVMIGAGMIKVFLILFSPSVLNILDISSGTYKMLSIVSDAGYYFMPVIIAISSAETFKTNKYMAALIGAMLLHPDFVNLVDKNEAISIFGLNVGLTSYANQLLPSIFAVYIMSFVYSTLDKYIPEKFRSIFSAALTFIIMTPIVFCLIGPVSIFLGNILVNAINTLANIGPVGNAIYNAAMLLIVALGLGGANLSVLLMMAATGQDPIVYPAGMMFNMAVGATCLAIYIRNKKSEVLAGSITVIFGGISEPAVFGTIVKDIYAIISVITGCAISGFLTGLLNVKTYSIASFGIFGLFATIGPSESSLTGALIALTVGSIVAFVLSFITHKKIK